MTQQRYIVFGFKGNGHGTTLTHVSNKDQTKTLCGKRISPEWMWDSDGVFDAECKRCQRALTHVATIKENAL